MDISYLGIDAEFCERLQLLNQLTDFLAKRYEEHIEFCIQYGLGISRSDLFYAPMTAERLLVHPLLGRHCTNGDVWEASKYATELLACSDARWTGEGGKDAREALAAIVRILTTAGAQE
jgi:hypothetical protein